MAKRRTTHWSRIVSILAFTLLVVALASCAEARRATEGQEVPPGDDIEVVPDRSDHDLANEPLGDEEDPDPEIEEPDPSVGATITVTGTVDEVVDRNAFEIAAQGRGGAGFLVLVPDDDVEVGDIVEVTGTVREPDFNELRADLDFEVDPDLYSQSDRQRVIVAESVDVVDQGIG